MLVKHCISAVSGKKITIVKLTFRINMLNISDGQMLGDGCLS